MAAENPNDRSELYFEEGTIVACTRYAAAYFGVTAATLSNWKNSGCPRLRHGYWDIKSVSAWLSEREEEKLADAALADPSKMSPAQMKTYYEAQLKQQQLEGTRLRNQIANGDYLKKSEIVEQLATFFSVFKSSVIGLGHELAQLTAGYVDDAEARRADKIISDRIQDALSQLSIDGVYISDSEV